LAVFGQVKNATPCALSREQDATYGFQVPLVPARRGPMRQHSTPPPQRRCAAATGHLLTLV
jgi:hypothetical protein